MKTKKIAIALGCLALCGVAVAGTYAYLNDTTDEVVNTFTSNKNVDIEVTETDWKEDSGKDYAPGSIIAKNPTVQNNSTNEDIYGALKLKFVVDGNEVNYTKFKEFANIDLNTEQWDEIDTDVYMFNSKIKVGKQASPELFKNVTINTDLEAKEYTKEDGTKEKRLPNVEIVITGYAVQSTNINDLTDAATALNALIAK